jgi:hypothetical protein
MLADFWRLVALLPVYHGVSNPDRAGLSKRTLIPCAKSLQCLLCHFRTMSVPSCPSRITGVFISTKMIEKLLNIFVPRLHFAKVTSMVREDVCITPRSILVILNYFVIA